MTEETNETAKGEGNDAETPLRRVGLFALAGVSTVALALAMGLFVSDGVEAEEGAEHDPLAELAPSEGLQPVVEDDQSTEVDRQTLTFPEALMAGAPMPLNAASLALQASARSAARRGRAGTGIDAADPELVAQLSAATALPSALPASVTARPSRGVLARAAAHDPMIASSLPAVPTVERAAAGHDGRYTLHVISYEDRAEAEGFAEALRSRGHEAFVLEAEIEERGTLYRVRIGPFRNMREANVYRREFEQNERMNTLVVRRREEPIAVGSAH